jgi:hypothetical protein
MYLEMISRFMIVIRWQMGAAKRPFGLAAPERPDHDS